ncbi:MAG TPA: phosphoglycerate dehydrogenase [Actinomycetota bacterium]|nr:phosphoglycerate dehydrogenase [Actinomycetota bacterium]
MRVLVAEKIAAAGIELLSAEYSVVDGTSMSRDELLAAIGDCDALIVRSATQADAELIGRAPNLKVIGRAGIGLDNVDVDVATKAGIVVVNAPTSNVISAAEHTIALMLSQARNIPRADASMRAGKWERSRFEGVELHGKILAILGLGRIGTLVAQRALAFGMKVIAFDPYVAKQRAAQMGVEVVETLEDALSRADFVTLHLPKTKETASLIGARELALMKPNARIVNASRGGMIDEAALAAAVREGTIGGAALDVYSSEPAPEDTPVRAEPNIVLTPHLGASTEEAQEKAGVTIAEQVRLALRGELAQYAVNVDAGREISDTVRPFIGLAERLGRLFVSVAGGSVTNVSLRYNGQIADHDTKVLTLSALRGMLGAVVTEPVTFVNAPLLAAERGIEYSETKSAAARDYVNVLEIRGEDGVGVAGTLVGTRNEERITRVYDFHLEMPPGEVMCFLRYDDRPGVIGAIGTILGERSINIADMRVGRQERGGEALMALSVDTEIPAEVLDELGKGSGAKSAVVVVL